MMGLPVQALTAKSRKSLKWSKPGANRERETCSAPGPSGCYWPLRSVACLIRISSTDTRLPSPSIPEAKRAAACGRKDSSESRRQVWQGLEHRIDLDPHGVEQFVLVVPFLEP